MGTKIRLTALILAASLTMNMVIMPVKAEDIAAPIEQLESEPVESIAAQTESSEPTSPTTESSEPTSPTTESSEPALPTTESSEPTSPTTESSEPTSPTTESSEPGTGEESSDLPGLLLTPEEEETLLEETGESMLFSTLTRAEPNVSEELKALAAETAVPLTADQIIEIHSGEELYFLANNVNPEIYQNCVLKFINSKNGFDVSGYADFPGLSNDEEHPFGGQIKFVEGSGSTVFKLKQPLFQYLSASARVEPLLLEYAGEETNQGAALFAANVVGNGGGGNWNFTLQGDSENKDVTCTPPLIGIIAAGSNVSLQVKDLIDLPVEAAGNAGAGLLCGTLNGSLTLTSLNKEKPISVKATDGAAGGLVGEMGANGSLTVNLNPVTENDISKPATLKIKDVSTTGNAGGLVGKMAAGATLTINTDVEISGSVTTSGGDAGGLVGLAEHSTEPLSTVTIKAVTSGGNEPVINSVLTLTGAISSTSSSGGGLIGSATDIIFDGGLPTISGTGSISGANAGGLIGSYIYSGTVNDSLSTVSQNISGITVNGSSNAGGVFGMLNNTSDSATFTISSPSVSTTALSGNNAGGLIGQYSASNLAAALNVTSPSVSSALSGSANTYGGLIGWVSGGSAYVEVQNGVSVSAKGTAAYYGGLIGDMYDSKNTGSAHMVKIGGVSVTNSGKGTSASGGLIGRINAGVLCLDGAVGTTPGYDNDKKSKSGNVVGLRNNTLVYTTDSSWSFNEKSLNDIGNWGQVLVASELPELLDDTSLTHSVKVNDLKSTNTISDKVDFGAAALRFQLDSQGALVIPDGTDFADTVSLTLSGTIDLSGTGLTGFQRDYYNKDDSSSVTEANVTLNGTENATIIFPDITVYTGGSHNRQGLFAKTNGLTVTGVTLKDGRNETNKTACGIRVSTYANDTYAGALVAESAGKVSLVNVRSSVNITKTGSNENERISGLIAYQNGGSVTFSDCEWDSYLKYDGSNACYIGGFLARTNEAVDITVTDCTISGSIEKTGGDRNFSGGLIGSLIDKNDKDWASTLTITGLTADGVTINSPTATKTGGILGWEWMAETTQISGVTVKNCTLNAPNARFGGLVYKGSGYWKVSVGSNNVGIQFDATNTFTGLSTKEATSGLLLAVGDKQEDVHRNALYLEILDGAYTIGENSVTLTNTYEYFDEIIGQTEHEKGNGIVSIATSNDRIDKTTTDNVTVRNTYEKQLTSDYKNGNTRYYYNLDTFRGQNPDESIDSAGEMVLFSAYSHCYSRLRQYFYADKPGSITGIIDLTGYSYYPAEQYATVQNATIKFDFANIETREDGNKKPSDATRQHAGMHTGIFRNVVNSGDSDATLSVTNLTLQGSVGHVDGRSGALICGDVHGNSTKSKKMKLEIKGVTLDGIVVSPAPQKGTVAPLLINSLGSYTTLNMSGVVTAGYAADVTAASSLIGPVGGDTGAAINLTFSDMALDGIQRADGKTYNGPDSIFSRALFLESFRYSESNCSGVYNFGDNATRYTVGQELSNTGGGTVDGRNNGAQYWFHNSDTLVCFPDTDKETHYQGYRRYVHWVEGKDGNDAADVKSHEIDVNVRTFGLTKGCGTYSHPYIITDGNQLKELAEVLNSGGKKEGWKVNLYSDVLNGNFSSNDVTCNGCIEYTGTANSWVQTGGPQTQSAPKVLQYLRNAYYVIRGPEDSETKEITLSGTWAGLGGNETSTAFSGVIVGEDGVTVKIARSDLGQQFGGLIKFSQGSVVKNLKIAYTETPTVTANGVPTTSDASFFGGVVGWCIGGDTIIDTVEVAYPNAGVTISGNNDHLTAVGGYVGMVGGAINDAGDRNREKYGGGVVFRNMTAGSALTGDKASESSNYFYYNPYVGRVLDGYVMLEKPSEVAGYVTSLNNTDKNYTIPTISAGTHLSIADGAVKVADAEGLWLLSAIANSGAGAMTDANCLAYNVGKPRTGTYANVGKPRTGTYANVGGSMSDDDKTDEGLLGGVGGKGKERTTCYLTKYVSGDFSNLCSSGVSIVLNSDCDMSTFGNGFRGIGSSYGTDADNSSNYRLIPVVSLSSAEEPKKTVTLQQSRKEYLEEMGNWTSIGSGLFVQLDGPSSGVQVSNLILSGSTSIQYYSGTELTGENPTGNHDEFSTRIAKVGSGMLAGGLFPYSDTGSITIENVELSNATVNSSETVTKNNVTRICTGSTNAGGLIGVIRNTRTKKNPNNQDVPCLESVTLKNCGYTGLNVTGRLNVGGFIGYVRAVKTVKVNNADTNIAVAVNILYSANKTLTNGVITSTRFKAEKEYGCGGLIGFSSDANLSIMPDSTSSDARLTLKNLTVHGNAGDGSGDRANVGGVVGYWKAQRVPVEAKNISLEGEVSIAGSENSSSKAAVGGFAGSLADNLTSWTSSTTAGVTIENFWIAQESDSNAKIYNGRPIGGLIGTMKAGNSIQVSGIKIGSDHGANDITGAVTVANNVNSNDYSHSVGGLLGSNHNVSTTITFEDIQMVHTTIIACTTSSDFRGAGIVFSHLENNLTVNLKNVLLDRCNVIGNKSDMKIGLLYSQLHKDRSNVLYGSNILIKDCVVGYSTADTCNTTGGTCPTAPASVSYDGTKMGIIGGESNGKTVKLVGVSIQQTDNTLPMKDFGTNPGTGSYVVRADYKGYQDGTITGAKAPYVTTSPLSLLGTLESATITGDGASFVKDTTTPVGGQILEDLKDPATNLNLKHSAALAYGESASDANAKKAYTYLLENSGKAFFGDFKQQGGNADYSDVTDASKVNFPVLTLVTNSSVDANRLIYSWISLLTNRTINTSSEGVTITLNRYKWSGNGWVTDEEPNLPLKFDDKTFSLNKGVYDSGQNRFTLLDVAFADPADSSKTAYHLYIPVIVQKMLRFRFWASAQTGTTYIKSSYMQQDALAAASHGQQVTVLMGFEYKRTQADWQEAVNNGDNLLFGFEKTIQLEGTSLPSGTCLTLVDCANQNKVYYADGSAITRVQGSETKYQLSFTAFDNWSPEVYLCDMLELSATGNSGQYYKLPEDADETTKKKATVRIANGNGYDYYQYKAAEDEAPSTDGPYSITVGWRESDKEPRLKEQYYLTIQTPEKPLERFEICNNEITCPSSLGSAKLLPTLRENNESGNKYTLNGNENRVLIGDFFAQEVAIDTVESYPEMSTANHTIRATLTSKIKFSSPQSAEKFKAYAEGQKLFQSFDLRMQKTEKAGEQAQRTNLVPGTRITAAYFLGDTPVGTKTYTIARSTPSFRLDFPQGVDVGNWDAQNGATFKAELTLEYPDAAILAQFPLINGNPGNLGVNLGTSSYLAYTEDALPTTTIHKDAQWDAQNFYRRDFKAASLNYYPVKRTANSTVESVNQLGVNGWNQQNSRINSAATYDASALDGAGNAKTLRCTLRLKQKANDDSYVEVDNWADYLAEGNNPTVSAHYNTSGVNAAVASSTLSRNVYTTQFTLTSYEKDVPIEIQVDMNVLTGAGFEAEGKTLMTYANYKVEMCVELLDSTGTNVIAGSRAEDYIVYTNARINPNPIR